jgi:hypothetical protein
MVRLGSDSWFDSFFFFNQMLITATLIPLRRMIPTKTISKE